MEIVFIYSRCASWPPKKLTQTFLNYVKSLIWISLFYLFTLTNFQINSWDKLKIPLPFSKGFYLWGKEIIKSKEYKNETDFNKKITDELNKNSEKIHDYF